MGDKHSSRMPLYGVGPLYGVVVIAGTILLILLDFFFDFPTKIGEPFRSVALILGILLILFGAWLWYAAVFRSKIEKGVEEERLITTGVYALVRNPIYSAFLIASFGAMLITGKWILMLVPFFFWGFLTVLMKHTEEVWLQERFGKEYEEYKAKVNRCIPWRR